MFRMPPAPAVLLCCLAGCSHDVTGLDNSTGELSFTTQPQAVWATQPFDSVQVASRDAHGNVIETFGGEVIVTLAKGASGAMLTGNRVARAVHGVATFRDLGVDRAGAGYVLRVSADGMADAESRSFDVASMPHLVFSGLPGSFRTGSAVSPAFQVQLKNDNGALLSGFNGRVTLSLEGTSAGTLGGVTTTLSQAGVANFGGVVLAGIGTNFRLKAEAPYVLAGQSEPMVSQPTLQFTRSPAAASSGVPIAGGIEVSLLRAEGSIQADYNGPVTVHLAANPGGASLSGTVTVNAAAGVATFGDLALSRPGDGYLLVASSLAFSGDTSAQFSVACYLHCWAYGPASPNTGYGAAVAMLGGTLYAAGGSIDYGETSLASVAGYDLATGSWQQLAPMHVARSAARAVAEDGLIYVIGGFDLALDHPLAGMEAYNPATNSWTTLAPMPSIRSAFGLTSVNGLLYVMGGLDESGEPLSTTSVYNPATNSWTSGPVMTEARWAMGATTLNGLIMLVGGRHQGGVAENTTSVEFLDPASGAWTPGALAPDAGQFLAALTAGSDVYVAGGFDAVWHYHGPTHQWEVLDPLPETAFSPGIGLTDQLLYVLNGPRVLSYRLVQ